MNARDRAWALKALKELCNIINNRQHYQPDPDILHSIINALEKPEVYMHIVRSMVNYNVNLPDNLEADEQRSFSSSSKVNEQFLVATSLLGLLILFYQPEYNNLIGMLLENGAKIKIHDILSLIAVAEKIDATILDRLLKSYDAELTPIINDNNIFHFLSLQPYVNETLIDFLLNNKLDPTVEYSKQKSGVTVAMENCHYALLHFYHKRGVKLHLTDEKMDLPHEITNKPSILETTADEFESEVKGFKHRHKIKSLQKWLSDKQQYSCASNSFLFLNNPIISDFLSRKTIETSDYIPHYPKHELSFYGGVKTLFAIPFRTDGSSLSKKHGTIAKVQCGTSHETTNVILNKLQHELPHSNQFIIILPQDTYDLSEQLELLKKCKNTRDHQYIYIFALTSKDSHILSTLSIIDTHDQQILFHIFINFSINPEYIKLLARSINSAQSFNGSALPEIYDGSIDVQKDPEDIYCASYSIEISRSLYLALYNNPELRLALEDFIRNNHRQTQWQSLRHQIEIAIKKNLPMFFEPPAVDLGEEDFRLKPTEEIINWHINNRIRYGADYIKTLKITAKKTIEENNHYIQQLKFSCS